MGGKREEDENQTQGEGRQKNVINLTQTGEKSIMHKEQEENKNRRERKTKHKEEGEEKGKMRPMLVCTRLWLDGWG